MTKLHIAMNDDGTADVGQTAATAQQWPADAVQRAVDTARVCVKSRGVGAGYCDCACCQLAVAYRDWVKQRFGLNV